MHSQDCEDDALGPVPPATLIGWQSEDDSMCVVDCDVLLADLSTVSPSSPDSRPLDSEGLTRAPAEASPRRSSRSSLGSRASSCTALSEKNLSVEVQLSIDTEVVRSVPLASSLRNLGWMWRVRPKSLSASRLNSLWEQSEKVDVLDIFLSHTWWTPGHHKFLSLLLSSHWHHALAAWLLAFVLVVLASYADLLPMPFSYVNTFATYTERMTCGPWVNLVSFCFATVALFAAPHLPASLFRSERCFYDVACIHQTEQTLRERGIYNIGGCLAMSKQLRILWSPPYFSRLWCVFEIAAYRRANPSGRLKFQPLFLERDFLMLWPCTCASMFLYLLMVVSGPRIFARFTLSMCSIAFVPGVHALRRGFQEQEQMLKHLADFDINEVGCSCAFDREFIFGSIARWYGSLEDFTAYVRGPLRDELGAMMSEDRVPISYCALVLTSVVSSQWDIFTALVKVGAPQEVLHQHLAGQVAFLILGLWSLLMLFWLSQRFAEPRFSGRAMDFVQTVGVTFLWAVCSFVPLGIVMNAYRASLTKALLSVAGASIILATSLLKASYSWCAFIP